jgi:hypothetical protein
MQSPLKRVTALVLTFTLTSIGNASDATSGIAEVLVAGRFLTPTVIVMATLCATEPGPGCCARKSFDAVDVTHQGRITLEQIIAYGSAKYAAR